MIKKRTVVWVTAWMLTVSLLLAGCHATKLYDVWELQYYITRDSTTQQSYPYDMSVQIREDGTVYMLGEEFATYKLDRGEFEITFTMEGETMRGAWILERDELTLIFDETGTTYYFLRAQG